MKRNTKFVKISTSPRKGGKWRYVFKWLSLDTIFEAANWFYRVNRERRLRTKYRRVITEFPGYWEFIFFFVSDSYPKGLRGKNEQS